MKEFEIAVEKERAERAAAAKQPYAYGKDWRNYTEVEAEFPRPKPYVVEGDD